MKGKIIVALAILAVAVGATGPANASCSPTKEFQLAFSPVAVYHYLAFQATDDTTISGAVIGRFWQPGLFSTTGNHTVGASGFSCPDDVWLVSNTIYGSEGGDAGAGPCDTAACPAGALIAVIQTTSLDGTKASYTAGRIPEGGAVAYDFSRSGVDWGLVDIPRPRVTVPSTGVGGSRGLNITVDLPDAAFHSDAGAPLLANGTITGYQIMTFAGAGDPGRAATAGWVNGAGSSLLTTLTPSGSITVDCTGSGGLGKVFVANRIVFDGGQFSSDYVSQSTTVNCSNLANPGVGRGKPIKKSVGN